MNPELSGPQRIGTIADATGLTPDAIRYYERVGLVPKPARTEGGFRVYPPGTVARLRFVKQAQKLGLGLRKIRDLLAPAHGQRREQCRHVRDVLAGHLADVEARMRDLEAFRETLRTAIDRCDRALQTKETIACPVVRDLEGGDA
jgi:MerR family mercuric resistance operon transcriptional regulator